MFGTDFVKGEEMLLGSAGQLIAAGNWWKGEDWYRSINEELSFMFAIFLRLFLITAMVFGLMACDDDHHREDLIILTETLPNGQLGEMYLFTLEVQGDADDFFVLGELPPNLSLSNTGVLSGTLTVADTFTFTIEVVDLSDGIVMDRFARGYVVVGITW